MANLKQATTPPTNLKNMQPVSAPPRAPSGIPPVALTGLGSTSIGPIPALLGTTYDTIRQWIRPSNNPQYRIFPMPVKASLQANAVANSAASQSVTPATSVPFNDVTTGINNTLLTVGIGGVLEASGTGVIDATEINGIPITGALTHAGMIPISQPGNTDAVWADPLVQGLYPTGTNVLTGGTGGTSINPVLVGAQNPSNLLENLRVDASGNLFTIGASGGATIIEDAAGNKFTSNSTTYTAKIALDENLLGTLGTAFTTPGFVDIKGADGNVFVRNATAANFLATVNIAAAQKVELYDGTNTATVKAASTAALASDTAIVVTEPGSTTAGACANTSVTSVSSAILASNVARREAIIVNTDVVVVYIGLGQVPTATAYHVALHPCAVAHDGTGGSFVTDTFKGAINAIVASTSGHVAVTELT